VSFPVARTPRAASGSVRDAEKWFRGGLWVLQALLAIVFAAAGGLKVVKSVAELRAATPWTADVPVPLVRVIGVVELLGALGLVLPAATRIQPQLTPVAATGLTTVMALAFAFHLYRGDTHLLIVPAVLALASCLVAWSRSRKLPIAPRRASAPR
jgi:uncharacterized membrane protein YphA (DoxX/SURF4 family)